ncbi:putative transposase within prophage [Klebsiella pneumoniae]|nr:putative transposase within prophage [Klebsiella pneumoniae]
MFAGKKSAQIREILISESAWEEMTCLFAPSLSESKGANFWLSILSDLQNWGIEDILIACVGGLTGFPEAINNIYPQTEVQLCVIHQISNSIKYVASNDHKAFMADLKPVYRAGSKEAAETVLDELEAKWDQQYPVLLKS